MPLNIAVFVGEKLGKGDMNSLPEQGVKRISDCTRKPGIAGSMKKESATI